MLEPKETFFVREKSFYKQWLSLMLFLALQNMIAYSVNMADNVMLGSYSQSVLSGAAIVNQLFFVVQIFANALGEGIVVLGSQYWGKKKLSPIRQCIGIGMKTGLFLSLCLVALCATQSGPLLGLFTADTQILVEAQKYLEIIQLTFPFFVVSTILYAGLRAVALVRIAFYTSIVSLGINVICNYLLIYGNMGCPELGIQGAAIGTLIARIVELGMILLYVSRDRRLSLFSENIFKRDPDLEKDYLRVDAPILGAQLLWALATPIQTAILGHLSSDAIAANSVSTTFYQYLKVIVQAMASASAVMMGRAVGYGDWLRIREEGRTISGLSVAAGLILGGGLYLLRSPLLSLYELNPTAMDLSNQFLLVMSVVMVGMSYQMCVSVGVIRGGGDTLFGFIMNMVSTWLIVMPLSFLGAFVWQLPVVQVVILLQADQVFKVIPVFFWYSNYRWVKKLAK